MTHTNDPIRKAAEAVQAAMFGSKEPCKRLDMIEEIIRKTLREAVPRRWGNDRDEAFNECLEELGL